MSDKKFEGLLLLLVGVGAALHYGKKYVDRFIAGATGEGPGRETSLQECERQFGVGSAVCNIYREGLPPTLPPPVVTPPPSRLSDQDVCEMSGGYWTGYSCEYASQAPPPQVPPPFDYSIQEQSIPSLTLPRAPFLAPPPIPGEVVYHPAEIIVPPSNIDLVIASDPDLRGFRRDQLAFIRSPQGGNWVCNPYGYCRDY